LRDDTFEPGATPPEGSEINALHQRVDAIRATGDAELAGRAWHALSVVLFSYTREKRKVGRFPIAERVTPQDIEWLLQDLSDARSIHSR
jgi:hypothetical protein